MSDTASRRTFPGTPRARSPTIEGRCAVGVRQQQLDAGRAETQTMVNRSDGLDDHHSEVRLRDVTAGDHHAPANLRAKPRHPVCRVFLPPSAAVSRRRSPESRLCKSRLWLPGPVARNRELRLRSVHRHANAVHQQAECEAGATGLEPATSGVTAWMRCQSGHGQNRRAHGWPRFRLASDRSPQIIRYG